MHFLSSSRLRMVFLVAVVVTVCTTLSSVGQITFAKSSSYSCPTTSENQIVALAEAICHGQSEPGWKGGPLPYSWGAGHRTNPGPSYGTCQKKKDHTIDCTATKVFGLDCSGFTRWVYYLAYGEDVLKNIWGDSSTTAQTWLLTQVPASSAIPGDLVFFPGHVGIYIGNGLIIHAPRTGRDIGADAIRDVIRYVGKVLGYYRYIPQLNKISGAFYSNPTNSGAFLANAKTQVLFTHTFQTINFNPDPSSQACSPSTGVDEYTRPFTDIYVYRYPASKIHPTGYCKTDKAAHGPLQAGLDNLYQFQAGFTAIITVPSAGTLTSTIAADDGFIFAVGKNTNGDQPTGNSNNPVNNAPASSPLKGYQVIAANNQPAIANPFTVVTVFPAAGTYPMELDYTECCGGRLSLILSNQSFTP